MRTCLAILLVSGAARAAEKADPAALARTIDAHIQRKLDDARIPAAPQADDAAYFRRLNLALAGRIPVASEVRAFLADTTADKRAKALDKILASAGYANHMTTTWRGWLIPEASTNFEVANGTPAFEAWLRPRIQSNLPFDKLVTELLTATFDGRTPAMARNPDDGSANPLTFYIAKDGKPENLAAATSRLFLGVQLECAQCHNHPFAKWSREQFWGLAAFYGGVTRADGNLREVSGRREMTIPNTERTVPATFLSDEEPAWKFKRSPRVTLAEWITAKGNPFFARAAVNRVWGLMFGVGIVDPVDDFNDQNKPSHPELLDELAATFTASGFDLKYLVRAIALSETYQRASVGTDSRQLDARLFARFPVQGLTPEQLFDSLSVVSGTALEGPGGNYLQANGSPKRQFLETFQRMGKATETQTTILQALTLMNGGETGTATTGGAGRTLDAIVELPGLTANERLEAIYLTVLSRKPTADELKRLTAFVDGKPERLADVLWVLLNGIEFRTLN